MRASSPSTPEAKCPSIMGVLYAKLSALCRSTNLAVAWEIGFWDCTSSIICCASGQRHGTYFGVIRITGRKFNSIGDLARGTTGATSIMKSLVCPLQVSIKTHCVTLRQKGSWYLKGSNAGLQNSLGVKESLGQAIIPVERHDVGAGTWVACTPPSMLLDGK